MDTKLTIGDVIGWAESDHDFYCIKCGRKVGKNAWMVHVSIYGEILDQNYAGLESQGWWAIGSECAKVFDSKVLVKMEAN